MDRRVTNSSPLIALWSIGESELLTRIFDEVAVPPAVQSELGAVPKGIQVVAPTNGALVAALSLKMDLGEAAALALAVELGWGFVADDRRARNGAHRLGVPVVGTVGVLLLGWRRRIVNDPVSTAQRLRDNGLWLTDELIEDLRRQIER